MRPTTSYSSNDWTSKHWQQTQDTYRNFDEFKASQIPSNDHAEKLLAGYQLMMLSIPNHMIKYGCGCER
jgi:hypothetical protein